MFESGSASRAGLVIPNTQVGMSSPAVTRNRPESFDTRAAHSDRSAAVSASVNSPTKLRACAGQTDGFEK